MIKIYFIKLMERLGERMSESKKTSLSIGFVKEDERIYSPPRMIIFRKK